MKKVFQSILCFLLAMFMLSSQAIAYSGNAMNNETEIEAVVDFDEAEIYAAFNEVDDLVATIESNESITYSDLEATDSEMVADVSSTNYTAAMANSSYDTPLVGPFWWGCILWIPGVVLAGLFTDWDNDAVRKAGWGCLITSLLGGTGIWGI